MLFDVFRLNPLESYSFKEFLQAVIINTVNMLAERKNIDVYLLKSLIMALLEKLFDFNKLTFLDVQIFEIMLHTLVDLKLVFLSPISKYGGVLNKLL